MRRINYKSDFDFVLKLKECKGENQEAAEVPFPDCDWEAVFYTSTKANSYTASCKGGEYVNCFKDEGGIHLVFNDHRMGVGTLKWESHFELPNDIYPDSIQDLFSKQQLGIELVNGPGDCPTTAEVEVLLPYIKGEPFTFEDFTPEQIEDLQKPATEAAERLDGFVKTASEAEAARELNEQSRVSAESERVSQEELRQTAETARQSNETAREAAEVKRAEAEDARRTAETERAAEFATWETELDGKQDKLSTTTDLHITDDNIIGLTELAKMRLFIDQWNAACGVFGKYDPDNAPDPKHPFYLNELWLTYKEAIPILESWTGFLSGNDFGYESYPCLTCIPMYCAYIAKIKSCDSTLMVNVRMFRPTNELNGRLSPVNCSVGGSGIFDRARFVRKWLDIVRWFSGNGQNTNKNTFVFDSFGWGGINGSAHPFEYFRFINTNMNVDCRYYPNIGIDSFQYLVMNRYPLTTTDANPFTVKVHPDTYAKLTGDTTNAAAAALTDEELAQWQQLLVDAAEKQITFTTT